MKNVNVLWSGNLLFLDLQIFLFTFRNPVKWLFSIWLSREASLSWAHPPAGIIWGKISPSPDVKADLALPTWQFWHYGWVKLEFSVPKNSSFLSQLWSWSWVLDWFWCLSSLAFVVFLFLIPLFVWQSCLLTTVQCLVKELARRKNCLLSVSAWVRDCSVRHLMLTVLKVLSATSK